MKNKKISKLASGVLIPLASFPLFLPVSANTIVNADASVVDGFNQINHYNYEDKYTSDLFWTSKYRIHTDLKDDWSRSFRNPNYPNDLDNYIQIHDASVSGFNPVSLTDSTKLSSTAWKIEGNNTWWANSDVQSRQTGKKYLIRFNANRPKLHEGFLVGSIYFSKDLALTGKLKITLRDKNNLNNIFQTRSFTISETQLTNDKTGILNRFLNLRQNINTNPTSNPQIWSIVYNPGYSEAPNTINIEDRKKIEKTNEYRFLNSNYADNTSYRLNVDTNRSGAIANYLINRRYKNRFELWDSDLFTDSSWRIDPKNWEQGAFNKYLNGDRQPYDTWYLNSPSLSSLRNESSTNPYTAISKNGGALLLVYTNELFYGKNYLSYIMDIEFEIKPNIFEDGTIPLDFNSKGESFFGVSSMTPQNSQDRYQDNYNRIVSGKDYDKRYYWTTGLIRHSDRKETTAIQFITNESMSSEVDASDVIPSSSILKVYRTGNTPDNTILPDDRNKLTVDRTNLTNSANKRSFKTKNSFILEPSTIIPNPSKTYRDELKKWTNDWLYLEVSLNETNDQMKWKPIINSDKKFTTSRTNAGYVEQNITWDYTDYEKLRRHINSKQWLTKAQKDHYLQKILNAADKNNYYSISEFQSLKTEIDKHDKAQMDVEEAYNRVVNYVLNNKTKFIFASESKKQEVVNVLNDYWEVGSFKSSFSNNNDRFLKRDEFTKFKTLTFLNDSLRTINYYINNLTNLDGDSRINAYKTSIEKINVIKDSTYNKAKFQKFLTEIQNDAVQELTLITPTVYGKNNIASLTALKKLWTSPWMNLNYWDKLDELKTSIQTTNSIYEKAKIINQEIQDIKTASTLTGDNSQNYYWYNYLQKFNDLSINSLWKGYSSLQTLATKENDWNELYKRIIGTSATDSNNIFSDAADKYKKDDNTKYIPENLKNISTLKTNYEETFKSLVDSLDFSFGNGARLVEEFEKYKYLDKTILRNYWSKTSTQKTYYFGDLRNIYNNNTPLNLRNFSISPSDALTLIKPDQTAVTNALKSISNHAYNLSADAIKTKIDNLSDLTKTRKQYYKSEIDKIVTAKSSVLYKNDTDFTSLWNAAQDEDTEQARINQIATQLASGANKFDYSNKSQTLVDNAIYTNFNVVNPQQYQNVRIEVKKVAQKDPIITGGRAKVNYVVYSTKAQYTHLASYHKTNDGSEAITDVNNEAAWFTSDWVTDFKADEVREKARLEALSLQFSNKHNKIHLPSEINTSNFNNEISISNSDTQVAFDPATEEVIVETLTPNDKDGTLSFTYKIRSKQITNPIVETTQKSATVITTTNQFKTEVDRLNEVLAQISATLKTEIANKANRLPSQVQNNEIEFNDLASRYNAKVILSNLSSNNDTGVLNVTYKLQSTRANYTDVVSTNTKDLTESGFLTLLEQRRRQVLKLVNDSTLLTEPEKTDFRNQVNAADTIPKLNALEQKIKIAELVNKVDQYTYLNNAQANHVKDQIRASRDYESANLIYNDASDLNDSMKELHEEVISELSQLTNQVISDNQDTSDKVNVNYTLASADKKSTYDNALRTAQTLLNKANGANESNPDNITSNLSTAFAQLDGTQNETRLHNQIDALTHLNTTQKSKLKASISRSKSLSDAEAIVTKATDLDTEIANIEVKINEAQELKTKTIYTGEDNKGPFDSSLSTATQTLNDIKSNDLDSFSSVLLEAKATELANKTANLTTAIANLDGERKQFKNDLKTKWILLEETEINNLVQKVDSIPKTDFNDTKKAQIIQEGFDLAKTKARTRLSSTSLPNNEFLNLNKAELDGYVGLVNLQSSNPKTTGKYDQKIADQLNNAKADNKTKQDAIDAINTLDTLTQDQKNIFINSVKDQVVASALKHQNDATELNNAIKDLKNVVLEKAKDLADDDTLEHTNMFNAVKTDKKYRLADTDKQTAYDNKLTQIQKAVSKSNVQKSEIEGSEQPFIDAFNALNGEDNETRLHNQINALSKLTLDQKTNLKKLVSAANSLVDAEAIVAKATTLNDAITTLEAKIAKAKEVKGQPIYIGEDNKTPFDDALSGAESALSTLKSDNLESSSAVDLQSKATDLSGKETALQNAIDNLDGIRKQFKKDLAQKWILLDESEKNALIDKVDTIDKNQFNDAKKEEIVKEGFTVAKTKAKNRLSTSPFPNVEFQNLNEAELNAIATKIDSDVDTPFNINAEKYDQSVVNTLNEAKSINDQKQEAINKINDKSEQAEYPNLTDNQRAEFVKSIKAQPLAKNQEILVSAKQLNQAIAEAKGVALEKEKDLTQNTALTFEGIPSNSKSKAKYKFASNQADYDSKLTELLNYLKSDNPLPTPEKINQKLEAFKSSYDALNGDEKLRELNSAIDELSNLNSTDANNQLTQLKTNIANSDNYAKASEIVEAAKKLNTKVGELNTAINQANALKNDDLYSKDTQERKKSFDDQIDAAQVELNRIKEGNLTSKDVNDLNDLTTAATISIAELERAKNNLNGYKEDLKNDLSNWAVLSEGQKEAIKSEIDGLHNKKPSDQDRLDLLNKYFAKAKDESKAKLVTTNYPNLTNNDLSELTTLVDANTTTVNTEKYQIHDQSLKTILDQAQAWEDAKIAAMDEIGRLSNLDATQISHLKEKVKTSLHSQTETIKNEAIELDKSIQALKDEALRELKELSKNSSLTAQNMFEVPKSANKYKFAEPSLQNAYNQQLEAAKTLLTKADATKDEVDQAKNNLLSAFNALNGDEKLNALKDEVNNLTHLSETQKNQIKNSISNSNSLASASEILEKAKELNQAIGNLKTKIQDAKAKKQDDIYTGDTSEKKQAFDQAITAAETALGNYESASLDALNATQLSEKANAVNTDISTLSAAINQLDGKRQALRNEINAYDSELISADEKQTYITQINSLNQTNPETTDSKRILDAAFTAAKNKAKDIVSGLGNLSQADKKKYKDLLEATVKGLPTAPDSNLKSIIEQAKRDNNAKQEAIERIKGLDNLTKEQKDEFEKQIKKAETSQVSNIETTATDLNTAIPAAKEKLAQLQAKKDEIKYKWADLTNKNDFDNKLQALNNLITSTGATKEKLEEAESNLDNSYNALNGDTKHNQLNAKIDQLTNLDANQRKQLKDKIVTFDDYEKAKELVNNAQTINDAIKKLEEKIADANTTKADEVYTLDEQTKKTAFDTALSHANDKLREYKTLDLTTLDNDSTNTKKAEIEKEVSDLDTEINKLDGYRHAFKESLKGKWHLLTNGDLAPLNAMVDKPDFPKKPEAVNKEEVWNEGLGIAKTKATEKLNSTTYNNLSAADLQTLKTEVTQAALNSNAQSDSNQKFDDAVKAILDKAQEQNQAKQDAINAIDALDNLTSEQKTKWKEKVKADVVAQAQNIKNDATTLDTAIKALKDQALSELKQLSKNPNLDADSMFSADKIADKYKLADANLKTEYDKRLANVQTLISKVDVTKDEIETAKSALNTAFSALNGDTKLSELEKEIDKLTNLSDEQRTKLKESIANAKTQDKASEIVEKARELNTKIGDLKAKIQEAKDKQNDPIYTKDTQNKKLTFDEAIKAAETSLENILKEDLGALDASQIAAKASEVENEINTLDTAINQLDGKKQALRDEINAYSAELIADKQPYLDKIEQLDRVNPDQTQADAILKEAFDAAKDKAKEIVNGLTNLSEADKNSFNTQLDSANKGTSQSPDSELNTIIANAKAADKTKQDAIERIKKFPNLNDEQKNEFEKQTKAGQVADVTTIEDKAKALNNAIPSAKTLVETKELNKNDINYKWADQGLKNIFDEKIKALKDLTESKDATAELIANAKTDLENAYNALNGGTKHENLNNKIDELTSLDETQRQALKEKIKSFDDYAKAEKLVTNAQNLNDAIKTLQDKISTAENTKSEPVYTLEEKLKKDTFDQAVKTAQNDVKSYQSLDVTDLDEDTVTAKKAEIATKVTNLQAEIDKLDGYRYAFKESLKGKWNLLEESDLTTLNNMVDEENFPKNPQLEDKKKVWNKGLELAAAKAKAKLIQDNYANLSSADLDTLKQEVSNAQLNENAETQADQKFDDAVQAILTKATQQNQTKQDAIDAIESLNNLTQAQKDQLKDKVKAQVVAQSESIKNEATELDKAIQLLNEEALRELKILSENNTLTTQNMFTAAKTANKYELADTNLKEAYEAELTKVQVLIAKADVTKSEIDNAKTSLEAAFNALNGDAKLNEIEKEIDKLNNLSDDQKEQIKNLVTNADTQEKANQILEKVKGLDKAIGDLKAKIEEAKNTKQDAIYSSDTTDKKSSFDNAITESETKLDEHLKVNLGDLSNEQILEKAKEVQADIKTLDDEIKKLDGKKQALRDEINAYSTDLISEEEKKSYIERIDALDRTNPDSDQANEILSDAFNKAKEKAKEIVNALDNLSDADKKTYTDALTNASKGAATAPDSNLKSIIEQAKAAQKTKQDAIDRIKELPNLTSDQKSELEKQIKEGITSGVADIEKKANDLNNAIPEAKNEITAKENSKNTINYKWADDNLKTAFDEKLKALKDLIASKDATAEQIKAAKKELQYAADALNGDQKHTALDNRIDQLSNINETRRNELKEKIKTLDNYSEAEKLVTNAESLNEAIQKLKDKIAQAENTKNQEVYTLDSDTKKNEFDEAINTAKEELKSYQDTNLTTLDDTAIQAKKTEIGTKVTNLQGEIDKLDGYRHAFKESLKDKWNLLTDNDFNTLNRMIDDPKFNKNPQDADKQTVLDKGLELAKNNATAKLTKQNYPNLSDADLQTLKTEVTNATLNSNAATTDTKFDDNIQAVLNKASQQNQAKQAKIAEIQNLSHLNQSQKDALVQEVKDSLHSQAQSVLEKAKTLDTKMKQLKDKVAEESTNKDLDAYQNASKGVKKAYENALENAKNVINNQPANNEVSIPANADATQVDQLISALDTALVDIKKDAAKNAVDNLNNLSKTEKNEYKDQIDQANTPEEAETIKEKAKNANDKKQEYIDRINQTPGLSEEEKQEYIDRIKETKFDSSEANNEQKFENIVLNATKQGLKNQIDGTYAYLNPKQKEELKTLIDSKTTIADAQKAFNSYSGLNNKMRKLKVEVIPAIETKVQQDQNKKHSKATATTKDVFDAQLAAAKDLLTSTTDNGENTLGTFIANVNTNNSLENLFAKLDGEIVVAKEKINDKTQFTNLNESEIEKLNEKLDAINLLDDDYAAQISKIIDQASAINTAKQERINQINSLTNLSDETSDTKPVSEKQAFINEAKDTVLEINANANPISITQDSANALDAIVLKSQKQDLINQIHATYEHLNRKQKQDLISAIQDANDLNTAQNAFNDAASVNTNMKSLKDIVKEFTDKDVANLDDYKFASDPVKQHYDDVFAAAKELINSTQNDGSANPSLTTLIADNLTLGSVKEAFANLDGLKNKAIKAVKALDNLNTTEVQKLSDQINNVSNTDENKAELIDAIVAKANEYNQAKADTITKLNKLTDLTKEQLKDYVKEVKEVEFTDTDQNPSAQDKLDKILDKAKKQGYKNLIDQLNSINQNQKDAYKARIDNAQDEAKINQILEEARAYDELKAKADALKIELDNYKNTIDYRLSEDEFKTSYDDKFTDLANEINNQSHANDLAALQELVKNAQQAKEALNGIEKNSEIAQAIEKLNNLSTEQQTQLKTLVEAQNSLADAETIKQNATDLNTKLTELKAKLTDANEVQSQPIYLLESQNEKDALNNAIAQADQLLSNVQNTQFDQNNLTNLTTLAQDAQAKTESLNNAIEQLNGVHKDLIAKIDEFELLTPEEKATLKETVKTFDKNLTKEQVLSHLENYLENSKWNAQTQVAQLSNLSDSEKAAYKQKLTNADLKYQNSTNPDWVIQTQDENNAKLKFDHDVVVIFKQAQADNAAKEALIDHINNDLSNLNQNQKATLVNKVKAADVSQVTGLTKYADDLDKAMLDYKNENFGDIKNEIDYTQASSERQKAFDVQLENQKNNTNVQNGADFDLDTVKAAHAKLIAAREALDGEERLAEAKAKAKAKVDNEYNNLSDAQKEAAKKSIDKQNTIADVEAKDVNHSSLDSAIELLNKHISEEAATKADIKYTGSEAAKRQTYDDAIAAAKELQAKLQESNTVADELLNTQAIQNINNRVQSALDALNGEQNMQKVRNEANNVIDSLEELNQAQKDSLKQTISKQTTPEAVAQETAKARELDASMEKLNDVYEVELVDKTKESIRYINADEKLQKDYDDALLEAAKVSKVNESQTNKKTALVDIEAVKKLATNLENAKVALNGDEKLNEAHNDAEEFINNLQHLNDAQKAELIKQAKEKDSIAQTEAIKDKAQKLDDAMKDLKDTIATVQKELQANPVKYDNADQELKDAYDQIAKIAKDLVAPSGENKDQNAVETMKNSLIDAKKALNGDVKFAKDKNNLIDQIIQNPDLTPSQKDKLVEVVNQASNSDELEKAKELFDTIKSKMEELRNVQKQAKELQNSDKYANASLQTHQPLDQDIVKNDEFLNSDLSEPVDWAAINDQIDQLIAKTKTDMANLTQEAQDNLDQAKESALAYLDDLSSLNNAQLDNFKDQINTANLITEASDSIESIKEAVNALNDLMSKLNDYIENVVESANNVDPRTSVNYINADQELKDNFDASYANATTLVDKELGANLNFDETNDAYLKLKKDFEALNGEQNKRLNAAELEKLVNEANEFVEKAPYTTSTPEKQNTYDVAIEDGKKVLENLENATVEEIQEAIDKIKEAIKQIYDNKEDLKNIVDELPNLSEQEKEHFKDLIQNEEDPVKRDEILREAQKISDQKQELINLINEQPNLSDADKEQLRDKVVNADSSQENWYDKLKDDITKANELIKKLVDDISNHTLNNDELDELIKDLADAGVTNPDYDKIVDGLKKYNDLTNALTNYRNSHVLDENYQDLKDALVAAIKDTVDFAVTHEELSKLKDQLVSQKEQLNQVANGEMNLVDSLINKDQSKFNEGLNSINEIISDKYSEFNKELSDKNYFEITNKPASKISENDINLINSIEQKDASEVIYSALQEALKTESKADNLSIFWWILLGLLTAGIGTSIYFLAKKSKKDEE